MTRDVDKMKEAHTKQELYGPFIMFGEVVRVSW